MKDLQELMNDFDSIQDIPISEEMLGAYVEGNLNGAELREIHNLINDNDFVCDLYSSARLLSTHIERFDSNISFGDLFSSDSELYLNEVLNTSIGFIQEIDTMNHYINEMEAGHIDMHDDNAISSHYSTNDNSMLDSRLFDENDMNG